MVVRSSIISRVTVLITHTRGLITPLITTPEPPSTALRVHDDITRPKLCILKPRPFHLGKMRSQKALRPKCRNPAQEALGDRADHPAGVRARGQDLPQEEAGWPKYPQLPSSWKLARLRIVAGPPSHRFLENRWPSPHQHQHHHRIIIIIEPSHDLHLQSVDKTVALPKVRARTNIGALIIRIGLWGSL